MINSNARKVAYWIGAGASARALPVVGQMPFAFQEQARALYPHGNDSFRIRLVEFEAERYWKYLFKMADWSKEYGTIDTYARSLYLLKKDRELAELKMYLGMFFILNQALRWGNRVGHPDDKPDVVDTRYMGWLALMLERSAGISDRVHVVSWNYDLQFEHALALYKGYSDLHRLHEDPNIRLYPPLTRHEINYVRPPSIVRLNGVAGHAHFQSTSQTLYGGMLGQNRNVEDFVIELFHRYKDYDRRDESFLYAMSDTLNFAWEMSELSMNARDLSRQIFSDASTLIIIGYSFPSFNRQVDKDLFAAFAGNEHKKKRIVIQNGSFTPETFRQMMSLERADIDVIQETNLDQFYIPTELF